MKTINNLKFNKWTDFYYKINTNNINDTSIRLSFSLFKAQVFSFLQFYEPVKYPSQIKLLI